VLQGKFAGQRPTSTTVPHNQLDWPGSPVLVLVQVIGVPDERLGEQVAAWIRLKDAQTCTRQEIVDFCKGKASSDVSVV